MWDCIVFSSEQLSSLKLACHSRLLSWLEVAQDGMPYRHFPGRVKIIPSLTPQEQSYRLANTLLKDGESTRDNHVLARNYFVKYSPIKKIHSDSAISSYLIWLLTTPQRLKYVAIGLLPCNLSL